jgi:hypothetical protein
VNIFLKGLGLFVLATFMNLSAYAEPPAQSYKFYFYANDQTTVESLQTQLADRGWQATVLESQKTTADKPAVYEVSMPIAAAFSFEVKAILELHSPHIVAIPRTKQ